MIFTPALETDLPEILALQKLAFQSEAEALNDWTIQPMTETLSEIHAEFNLGPILKAVDEHTGKIVGSIRAQKKNETLLLGKLIVHPDFRRQKIALRLLDEIESSLPHLRTELFTRADNLGNIALYRRAGFHIFKTEKIHDRLSFVFFEKQIN